MSTLEQRETPDPIATMPLRELAARKLCELRGQDPDRIVPSLNSVPFWTLVASTIIDPACSPATRAAIAWAEAQQATPQPGEPTP